MSCLPLHGIRVLDLTQIRAGPKGARWLADAGAEVIKVESRKRPDGRGFRRLDQVQAEALPGAVPEEEQRRYNRTGFDQLHRNKLGLSLDISTPEGQDIFRRLVAVSDVVMENFSLGVMDRLGLGYRDLTKFRPDLIMISMPAFGNTGPDRNYVAFGWAQEHMAGIGAMTGYEGGPPLKTGTIVGDPLNGVHAAAAIVTALVYRARTGKGQFIEFSQLESLIGLVGDAVLDYTVNGHIQERMGNRHLVWAPQDVYRCAGDDQWVAITVTSDREWAALCQVIGRPDLIDDPRFATLSERRANQDLLRPAIEAWTSPRTKVAAMEELQQAGIRAGAVFDQNEALMSPQSEARGFLQWSIHPDGAAHPYMNLPWRLSTAELTIRQPAPLLGEHNPYLLRELLGMPEDEFRRLEYSGIIATFSTDPSQSPE
ncbi:MAG: CoA transferase [Chloroflexi bacterium]|nr:CoA transferase [Chloroflexota bacterium]